MFAGKRITVGITGGIAAYKAADIVSWLTQQGAQVQVAMTRGACEIIQPLTLKTLSGRPVALDLFDEAGHLHVPHIDLADCDALLVLPATANILAKAAHGIADDLLSATLLAITAPVLLFPAMNMHMYANPATQANLQTLRQRGYRLVEPAEGRLACGTVGPGRLPDTEILKAEIRSFFQPDSSLCGKNVLITAGPTYEYIDPVRFIGNRSSGKMGYALAAAAAMRGARVTLVSGPTSLADPATVQVVRVTSAQEMYDAVWQVYPQTDIVIAAAAVADYRPDQQTAQKIKKGGAQSMQLVPNADILASLGAAKGQHILVGFAAETQNLTAYAEQKLREKNLDMIVANDVLQSGAGFEGDTNVITILWPDATGENHIEQLPLMSKRQAAERILEQICTLPRFTADAKEVVE